MELTMVDRHWLGDLSLAVLLVLPLLALARPHASETKAFAATHAGKVAVVDRVPGNGRIGLFG